MPPPAGLRSTANPPRAWSYARPQAASPPLVSVSLFLFSVCRLLSTVCLSGLAVGSYRTRLWGRRSLFVCALRHRQRPVYTPTSYFSSRCPAVLSSSLLSVSLTLPLPLTLLFPLLSLSSSRFDFLSSCLVLLSSLAVPWSHARLRRSRLQSVRGHRPGSCPRPHPKWLERMQTISRSTI